MPAVRVRCPNPDCRAILSIQPDMLGQRVRCAACGESFLVRPASPRVYARRKNLRASSTSRRRRRAG